MNKSKQPKTETTEERELNCGVVRNIPGKFRSTDLRNFFSDFIERGQFKCFHYKHRPEVNKNENDNKPRKLKTCCSVFEVVSDQVLSDFISTYNDVNWIDSDGNCLQERCIIRKIDLPRGNQDKNNTEIDLLDAGNYLTKKEKDSRRRHAVSEEFSRNDLLALSEMRPPIHVMPRGNVGSTIKEFQKLINECQLPPKIIKKLGLKFPKTGSTRRYGNVPFKYRVFGSCKPVEGTSTYTAGGDEVGQVSVGDEQERRHVKRTLLKPDGKGSSESDEDNDTCEEWERHEALHNDVTSQGREKERLFEEKIELKWEKGGSGLVFYTDAQFWAKEDGDFDEETADDWDVDMSEYYGEKGDLDARQFLQMRKEKRDGKAIYDYSLYGELRPQMKRKTVRARSESPPNATKKRGQFERYTKGVGRKLLEKGGWVEGDPLGPKVRSGAITDPIELEGQHPRLRKGLGYHGEKLLVKGEANNGSNPKRCRIKVPKTIQKNADTGDKLARTEKNFRGTRSVEPNASHSYHYPQFHFNLPFKFKERTKAMRKAAIPGTEDGIVITTSYDEPLDIDGDEGLLRSIHPTALKHRSRCLKTNERTNLRQSLSNDEKILERASVSSQVSQTASSCSINTSKLVRNDPSPYQNADHGNNTGVHTGSISSSNAVIHSTVKFVSGGVLRDNK